MGDIPNTVQIICPDHPKLIEQGIIRHFFGNEHSDIMFSCDGNEIHAHRLIISIFLPKLINNLGNFDELNNLKLNSDTLPLIIEFVYTGKLQLAYDQLTKLKNDAAELNFELLVETINCLQTSTINDSEQESYAENNYPEQQSLNTNKLEGKIAAGSLKDPEETLNLAESVRKENQGDNEGSEPHKMPIAKSRPTLYHKRITFIRCCHCDLEIASEQQYLKHLKEIHDLPVKKDEIKITYRCYRCDFTTENRSKWRTHRSTESRRGAFKCAECDLVFQHKIYLERHVQYNHSTDRPYHCDKCEYKGKTYGLLKDHKKIHKCGNFKCSICSMTFKLKTYLERHMTQMHAKDEDRNIPCHLCPKSFVRRCDLNVHLRISHHVSPPKVSKIWKHYKRPEAEFQVPVSCRYCDFNPKHSKVQWIYHLAAKHQEDVAGNKLERNIKCNLCDRMFYIDLQLYNHQKMMHKSKSESKASREEKSFMCETCGYRTKFKHRLTDHLKTHLPTNIVCQICEKKFKSERNLKKHGDLLHSTGAKTFKCQLNECSFSTKTKWCLKDHVSRMHKESGEN